MNRVFRNLCTAAVVAGLAATAAACSGGSATSSVTPTGGSLAGNAPINPGPNLRQADVEFFEICKDYPGGTGPAVTFTVAADIDSNTTVDQTYQVVLNAGECKDVWVSGGAVGDTVTVTESVPANHTVARVVTTLSGGSTSSGASVASNTATGNVRAGVGILVVFTNTPPTPPPPGLQGCTPGYWKQDQHFDSWTAPYTPSTQFSAVFDNAFPGMTLLQVLGQGGGGLNALGRHTVAALLSSASSGVSYGMTPAQVIAAFNAAFPSSDYSALHNQFATANERGCPLN